MTDSEHDFGEDTGPKGLFQNEPEIKPERKLRRLADILGDIPKKDPYADFASGSLQVKMPKPEPEPTHFYKITFAPGVDRDDEIIEANALTIQSTPGNALPMIAFGIEDTQDPKWRPGSYRIKRIINALHVLQVDEIDMGVSDDDIPRPEDDS